MIIYLKCASINTCAQTNAQKLKIYVRLLYPEYLSWYPILNGDWATHKSKKLFPKMGNLNVCHKFSRILRTTYDQICILDANFTCLIGGILSPFKVSSDKFLVEKGNTFAFRVASIFHCIICTGLLVNETQETLYNTQIKSNSNHTGQHLGALLMSLYLSGVTLSVLLHINRKLPEFLSLVNFLNNFEKSKLDLGNINTKFMKAVLLQVAALTSCCSAAIAVSLVVTFHTDELFLWSTCWKVLWRVYLLWDLTWAMSLNLFVGFCGLCLGYGVIYVASMKIYRYSNYIFTRIFNLFLNFLTGL